MKWTVHNAPSSYIWVARSWQWSFTQRCGVSSSQAVFKMGPLIPCEGPCHLGVEIGDSRRKNDLHYTLCGVRSCLAESLMLSNKTRICSKSAENKPSDFLTHDIRQMPPNSPPCLCLCPLLILDSAHLVLSSDPGNTSDLGHPKDSDSHTCTC